MSEELNLLINNHAKFIPGSLPCFCRSRGGTLCLILKEDYGREESHREKEDKMWPCKRSQQGLMR